MRDAGGVTGNRWADEWQHERKEGWVDRRVEGHMGEKTGPKRSRTALCKLPSRPERQPHALPSFWGAPGQPRSSLRGSPGWPEPVPLPSLSATSLQRPLRRLHPHSVLSRSRQRWARVGRCQ